MLFRSARTALLGATASSLLLLAAMTPRAYGQLFHRAPPEEYCPADIFGPSTLMPSPSSSAVTPPDGTSSSTTTPSTAPDFGESGGLVARGEGSFEAPPGAYLDAAIPMTMFRLRYDDALNINRPDRAQFLYAEWKEMSFHPHGILKNGVFTGVFFDPNAQGPVQSSGQLNMQEISGYLEYAFSKRLSVFADVPYRILHFGGVQEDAVDNAEIRTARSQNNLDSIRDAAAELHETGENRNPSNSPNGLSDIQFGFKFAIIADPNQYLTFQLRTYSPSGDPRTGLGTGHWSIEPGLLYNLRLGDRWTFQAELEDWLPIKGGPFDGPVLTYGLGLGYDIYQSKKLRITPITEFVGWTVLGGYESFFIPGADIPEAPGLPALPEDHGVVSAYGDTIVNGKIGVRTYFGDHSDIYIGYGRSLTGDRWYKDIYRVEYRLVF